MVPEELPFLPAMIVSSEELFSELEYWAVLAESSSVLGTEAACTAAGGDPPKLGC